MCKGREVCHLETEDLLKGQKERRGEARGPGRWRAYGTLSHFKRKMLPMRVAAAHAEAKMGWAQLAGLAVSTAQPGHSRGVAFLTSPLWAQVPAGAVLLEPSPAYPLLTQEARPSQLHRAQDGAGDCSWLEEADQGCPPEVGLG